MTPAANSFDVPGQTLRTSRSGEREQLLAPNFARMRVMCSRTQFQNNIVIGMEGRKAARILRTLWGFRTLG